MTDIIKDELLHELDLLKRYYTHHTYAQGTVNEDIFNLINYIEKLHKTMKDFADKGTRHDTNPTMAFRDMQSLAHGYVSYINRMDTFVRNKASTTLEGLTDE